MAEVKLNGQAPSATEVTTPRELTLVREACSFFANAGDDLATHVSIVVTARSSQDIVAMAEHIAEEYGLRAQARIKGKVLILELARAAEASPAP